MSETAAHYGSAKEIEETLRRRRGPGPEYYESVLLADWLSRVAKVLFTHVPNGELREHRERIDKRSGRRVRYSPTGIKLQRMGVMPGMSDYIIFDRPPAYECYKGAVLELKAKKEDGGRPPTPEQEQFLNDAAERGYAAGWFYGADEAIEWCRQLGWGAGSK